MTGQRGRERERKKERKKENKRRSHFWRLPLDVAWRHRPRWLDQSAWPAATRPVTSSTPLARPISVAGRHPSQVIILISFELAESPYLEIAQHYLASALFLFFFFQAKKQARSPPFYVFKRPRNPETLGQTRSNPVKFDQTRYNLVKPAKPRKTR